jgi:hypothetical protein
MKAAHAAAEYALKLADPEWEPGRSDVEALRNHLSTLLRDDEPPWASDPVLPSSNTWPVDNPIDVLRRVFAEDQTEPFTREWEQAREFCQEHVRKEAEKFVNRTGPVLVPDWPMPTEMKRLFQAAIANTGEVVGVLTLRVGEIQVELADGETVTFSVVL